MLGQPEATEPSCSPLAAVGAGRARQWGAAAGAGSACSLPCFQLEFQLSKRLLGAVVECVLFCRTKLLQPLETFLKSMYVNTDGRWHIPSSLAVFLNFNEI